MSAWTQLLAASSLSTGTAWQLLSAPKTGMINTGVIVNDGVTVEIELMQIEATLDDTGVIVNLEDTPIVTVVNLDSIIVEITE